MNEHANARVISAAVLLCLVAAPGMALQSTVNPATRDLLISAAKTESDAELQYASYSAAAKTTGHPDLANLWHTIGQVEHQDHWTHEVTLANLYSGSDNIANLKIVIPQIEKTAMADRDLATKAPEGSVLAAQLQCVADREDANVQLLKQALAALQGQGKIPDAPAVKALAIAATAKPLYSGSLYTELTDDSSSALERAAWNWATFQFLAKTAADTGHGDLAILLSTLEAQEKQMNWSAISNAAGYVNGDADNLTTSIASEQGAIDMYNQYAQKAKASGDAGMAHVFLNISGDESGHKKSFATTLKRLNAGELASTESSTQ